MNKLGQKHASLNLGSVHGMALTNKQKKRLMKKQKRAAKFAQDDSAEMDDDWESASDEDE